MENEFNIYNTLSGGVLINSNVTNNKEKEKEKEKSIPKKNKNEGRIRRLRDKIKILEEEIQKLENPEVIN